MPFGVIDCLITGLRSAISDADLVDTMVDGTGSTRMTNLDAQPTVITRKCASNTKSATPDIRAPEPKLGFAQRSPLPSPPVRRRNKLGRMATNVEFGSNGDTAGGYLALPASGRGPGVLVLQEWWGLDPALKTMADRLAEAGFVALAPDLYRGELAGHDEMDKAAGLMNSLPPDRAARDMSGAVDFLVENEATTGDSIGVMGFCMGGLLTFLIAAGRGDRIAAAVPFYGFPPPEMEPDWAGLTAAVRGHMAGIDDFFAPAAAAALEAKLQGLGKDVQLTIHEGAGHAFMNPENSIGNLDEALAAKCWAEATAFLHDRLG